MSAVTKIRPRTLTNVVAELCDTAIRLDAANAMRLKAFNAKQHLAVDALDDDIQQLTSCEHDLRIEAIAMFEAKTGCGWDDFTKAVA